MLKKLRTNNRIRVPEIQVIDENGDKLGILQTSHALSLAQERGLDLVEVAPNERPPIAKIMDYGRYTYQKEKQEKKSGAHQKTRETKTIRVGYKTGDHDLCFKAKKADEFLNEDCIVKVELTLRGREKALAHLGKEKLKHFLTRLETLITQQGEPRRSPYGWVVMIQKDKKASSSRKIDDSNKTAEIKPEYEQGNETKQSATKAHQNNEDRKISEASSAPKSL